MFPVLKPRIQSFRKNDLVVLFIDGLSVLPYGNDSLKYIFPVKTIPYFKFSRIFLQGKTTYFFRESLIWMTPVNFHG